MQARQTGFAPMTREADERLLNAAHVGVVASGDAKMDEYKKTLAC